MKKSVLFLGICFIFLISFVSAYSYGYYDSPLDYLDNEWVFFGLVFIVLFSIIFYALSRSMSDKTIAGVISFAMSLFVTIVVERKGWLDDYSGEGFFSLVLIAVFLIIMVFIISMLHKNMGIKGVSLALIGIWIALNVIEFEEYLDWELWESIRPMYEFISSGFVLVGLILLAVFAFNKDKDKMNKKKMLEYYSHNPYSWFSRN